MTLCDLGYPWPLTLNFQCVVHSNKAYVFFGVYIINIGRNMVKNVDLTLALGELGWPWPLTLTFQGALHWDKTIVFCLSFYGQYRMKYSHKCKFDLDLGDLEWHWSWPWPTWHWSWTWSTLAELVDRRLMVLVWNQYLRRNAKKCEFDFECFWSWPWAWTKFHD